MAMSKDSFIIHLFSKSVSLLPLIVSTWSFTIIVMLLAPAFLPVVDAVNDNDANFGNNAKSNITLLDLYPELKDYLWKRALTQLSSSTTVPNADAFYPHVYNEGQQNAPTAWGNEYMNNNFYGVSNGLGVVGGVTGLQTPSTGSNNNNGYRTPGTSWNSREDPWVVDSDPEGSNNFQKEVLKGWHPFGTPEFYDSWKFKPTPQPPQTSAGWSSGLFPFWEEETEEVSHELSKDFSCLAGLLGLKTLKKLKFAAIFKKVKIIGIFLIAFKLGVLLSPIAIPLLFPIILLVTAVKILPLILIIVLLLKILKKQVKIKKPFGKFLDHTSSLFFDEMDIVTEKVVNSDDEYIEKLANSIGKNAAKRSRTRESSRRNRVLDTQSIVVLDN